jgi:hypothetical protein
MTNTKLYIGLRRDTYSILIDCNTVDKLYKPKGLQKYRTSPSNVNWANINWYKVEDLKKVLDNEQMFSLRQGRSISYRESHLQAVSEDESRVIYFMGS